MNKRMIFKRGDKTSVVSMSPTYFEKQKSLGKTDEEIFAAEAQKLGAVNYKIVDKTDIPTDRYFRNAWDIEGESCTVCMDKARAIHMNEIRKKRDKKLAKLDIEQLKGNEVAAEKQALRDLPDTFDLTIAQTPEELKALWPSELD